MNPVANAFEDVDKPGPPVSAKDSEEEEQIGCRKQQRGGIGDCEREKG